MTKEEKIKKHLRKIEDILEGHRVCIPPRSYPPWRVRGIVSRVRRELVVIEALLQPRPETLASSVLRLTDELNESETRVRKLEEECVCKDDLVIALKLQLSQNIGCLRNHWDKIETLEAELAEERKVALSFARGKRRARYVKYLEQARSADDAYIQRLMDEMRNLKRDLARRERYTKARKEHIKTLNRNFDAAARNNTRLRKLLQEKKDLLEILHQGLGAADKTIATLQESIVKQNKYIELLKQDRRTLWDERRNR